MGNSELQGWLRGVTYSQLGPTFPVFASREAGASARRDSETCSIPAYLRWRRRRHLFSAAGNKLPPTSPLNWNPCSRLQELSRDLSRGQASDCSLLPNPVK